jgi:hypothetical protein
LGLRSFQVEVISFVAKSRRASGSNVLGRVQSEEGPRCEAPQIGSGELLGKYNISLHPKSPPKFAPTRKSSRQCGTQFDAIESNLSAALRLIKSLAPLRPLLVAYVLAERK